MSFNPCNQGGMLTLIIVHSSHLLSASYVPAAERSSLPVCLIQWLRVLVANIINSFSVCIEFIDKNAMCNFDDLVELYFYLRNTHIQKLVPSVYQSMSYRMEKWRWLIIVLIVNDLPV